MIRIYGIPNCDTIKKARKWLEANGLEYEFHDFKKQGAPEAKLRDWAREAGWEAEGIEISDDEIDAELAQLNEMLGGEQSITRDQFEEAGRLPSLAIDISKRKAMDLVLESVEIVDDTGAVIDPELFDEPDPEPDTVDAETADAATPQTATDDAPSSEDAEAEETS